jgi:acetylornithine/N-succinyldiaminopimelate aminotransferase
MTLFDVYPLNPIVIDHAMGSFVWDNEGTKYLDLYGGHAVISIGHTHPHYVRRIEEQLHKLGFYSNSVVIPLQEQLAQLLGEVSDKNDYRLFLCNSGAEANENAIKLASFHTGRRNIVAFSKAFHGRTSLAVAATDNPSIVAPVNETDAITFLPFNDVAALETWFSKQGDSCAAVITEGIQGVGGIREASAEFLQAIRRLCDRHGSVFIADSVQCGYGRSGTFFSHDQSGVEADIYTMAKGMGNGFPIGGIIIAPHIKAKHGMLGTTFGGNPLGCAAAVAVLEVIRDEKLIQHAAGLGAQIKELLGRFPGLKNVRGKGLMIGFDTPDHLDFRKQLLSEHHIFTGEAKGNVVRLLPALNLQHEDLSLFFNALTTIFQPVPATT